MQQKKQKHWNKECHDTYHGSLWANKKQKVCGWFVNAAGAAAGGVVSSMHTHGDAFAMKWTKGENEALVLFRASGVEWKMLGIAVWLLRKSSNKKFCSHIDCWSLVRVRCEWHQDKKRVNTIRIGIWHSLSFTRVFGTLHTLEVGCSCCCCCCCCCSCCFLYCSRCVFSFKWFAFFILITLSKLAHSFYCFIFWHAHNHYRFLM